MLIRCDVTKSNAYHVVPVVAGAEQDASAAYTLSANASAQQFLSIPLRDGGLNYSQANVGDLDGTGNTGGCQVEQISKCRSGSHTTATATVYVDAYKLDGSFLWRVDLGWNSNRAATSRRCWSTTSTVMAKRRSLPRPVKAQPTAQV